MVKTRVHDLAAEFGVPPEQLLGMLKDMNIFVRSHLSALENDQVSAIRVRWEREKRKSAEEPAAKKGRRKAVKAEPPPAPVEARPAKRRRTAAEVAVAEAQAESERAAELAALELERPIVHDIEEPVSTQSLEERARALFKDLPPAPAEPYQDTAATEQPSPARPADAAPAPPRRVTPTESTRAAGPSRSSAAAPHPHRDARERPRARARVARRRGPSVPTPRRAEPGRRARRASGRWWTRTRCRPTSCAPSRA